MKRDKRITIKDMFSFYPYKKNIKTDGNTIPQPYIKKSDVIEDHPESIDFNQWQSVVNDYLDIVIEVLLTGKEYSFPNYLGKLQFRKYKTTRLINWRETSLQNKKVYYRNKDSLRVILKWYRDYKIARFRYRFHWKIRMAKKLSMALHEKITKHHGYIYNILDI